MIAHPSEDDDESDDDNDDDDDDDGENEHSGGSGSGSESESGSEGDARAASSGSSVAKLALPAANDTAEPPLVSPRQLKSELVKSHSGHGGSRRRRHGGSRLAASSDSVVRRPSKSHRRSGLAEATAADERSGEASGERRRRGSRRARAHEASQRSSDDESSGSAGAAEADGGAELRAVWRRFEARLEAALGNRGDALRDELMGGGGGEVALDAQRRRQRISESELLGGIRRKDAPMHHFIELFKRDWEILQFRERRVAPLRFVANERAPSLPLGNLASWLEPIISTTPRSHKKSVQLNKELVAEV